MGQEAQPTQNKDVFPVYRRRIPLLMIMMGISFIAMEPFVGLALVSQLNIFKWLAWFFAATCAVLCCMTIILLIRLLRLMIR